LGVQVPAPAAALSLARARGGVGTDSVEIATNPLLLRELPPPPPLRTMQQEPKRGASGYWQNIYHRSDVFGAPLRPMLPQSSTEALMVEDTAVNLGGASATSGTHGIHGEYFSKRGSAEVAAPIAEHLARLWLAANQPLAGLAGALS